MSWKATAYVKTLTHLPDGLPLSPHEKLILFVLADYHNADENCAWCGMGTIARESLASRRTIIRKILHFEQHGLIRVRRQKLYDGRNENNLYFFAEFEKPREVPKDTRGSATQTLPPSDRVTPPTSDRLSLPGVLSSPPVVTPGSHHRSDTALSPKPPYNRGNNLPPLPPEGGATRNSKSEQPSYISWHRETIEVFCGNHRRIFTETELASLSGGRAEDAVELLNRKGFRARVMPAEIEAAG